MASENIVTLTSDNFDSEVLKSDLPVMVDFWAPWCGPCRSIARAVEELAEEYAEKMKVCKLNVDDNQELAAKYRVMSIPTIYIFKEGEPQDKIVGGVAKDALEDFIEQFI